MAGTLLERILPLYPDHRPLLSYANPFQLLIAVILSAQCTDEQVNRVTPVLFGRWPDPAALAEAPIGEIEDTIRSAGFFRVKARYLKECSARIMERPGMILPETMEGLTDLPGVGRKSAHLVRSACFGYPGIIADTHFIRVLHRSGIIPARDPLKAEWATRTCVEEGSWTAFSHAVNRHGKFTCTARSPRCGSCLVAAECPKIIE